MMLFREDGQVDLARAGRGGRDVLVCVDIRLEVRVDLHLSRLTALGLELGLGS